MVQVISMLEFGATSEWPRKEFHLDLFASITRFLLSKVCMRALPFACCTLPCLSFILYQLFCNGDKTPRSVLTFSYTFVSYIKFISRCSSLFSSSFQNLSFFFFPCSACVLFLFLHSPKNFKDIITWTQKRSHYA